MPEIPHDGSDAARGAAETLYLEHHRLLLYIAAVKFEVPFPDAEALAHDVFLSYLRDYSKVRAVRPWLIGAIVNACQTYWHERHRHVQLSPALEAWLSRRVGTTIEELDDEIAIRELVGLTSPRCQQLLTLRYRDGFTIAEIAHKIATTVAYARKLVFGCVTRLRTAVGRSPTRGS